MIFNSRIYYSNMRAGLFQGTYTIDDAVEKIGFGIFQLKLSFVAGLACMADSMEMMVLSILSQALLCDWSLSLWEKALITTVYCQFLKLLILRKFNFQSGCIFWYDARKYFLGDFL